MLAALLLTAFWHKPVDHSGKSPPGLCGGCSSSAANAAGPATASRVSAQSWAICVLLLAEPVRLSAARIRR
jgi:hypothetical protein